MIIDFLLLIIIICFIYNAFKKIFLSLWSLEIFTFSIYIIQWKKKKKKKKKKQKKNKKKNGNEKSFYTCNFFFTSSDCQILIYFKKWQIKKI